MPTTKATAKTIAQSIITAVEAVSDRINAYPFGRMQVEWQDGKPVLVEVTTKHKPEQVKS